jgi:flagellar biosynthetic protein FliR
MNDASALISLGILMVRPGMLIIATPVFGGDFVPPNVRIALTAIIGLLLMPLVQVSQPPTAMAMGWIVFGEAVVGLSLAMSLRVLVAGAELAGQVTGFQIGISYAALVDPMSGARNNILSLLYSSLTILTFLGINGHHILLRALSQSYVTLPPGTWHVNAGMGEAVMRLLGIVFALGVQLAMPIVIVLLLVEVVMGLISRVAPALNLMVVGFPLRVGVGMLALAAGIQVVPGVVAHYVPAAIDAAMRLAGSHP